MARDIASQIAGGSHSVFGVMIESHINAGAQKFTLARTTPARWNMARASPMPARVGTIPGGPGRVVGRSAGSPLALT